MRKRQEWAHTILPFLTARERPNDDALSSLLLIRHAPSNALNAEDLCAWFEPDGHPTTPDIPTLRCAGCLLPGPIDKPKVTSELQQQNSGGSGVGPTMPGKYQKKTRRSLLFPEIDGFL